MPAPIPYAGAVSSPRRKYIKEPAVVVASAPNCLTPAPSRAAARRWTIENTTAAGNNELAPNRTTLSRVSREG